MADLTFRPEIEVLSAADGVRRRHWSEADKLRIVEESFVGSRQASATARRHGISRSLLTIWRRQYRSGELGAVHPARFTPLALAAGEPQGAAVEATASAPEAMLELVLTNGRRLVMPINMDPGTLARLLPVVDSR